MKQGIEKIYIRHDSNIFFLETIKLKSTLPNDESTIHVTTMGVFSCFTLYNVIIKTSLALYQKDR